MERKAQRCSSSQGSVLSHPQSWRRGWSSLELSVCSAGETLKPFQAQPRLCLLSFLGDAAPWGCQRGQGRQGRFDVLWFSRGHSSMGYCWGHISNGALGRAAPAGSKERFWRAVPNPCIPAALWTLGMLLGCSSAAASRPGAGFHCQPWSSPWIFSGSQRATWGLFRPWAWAAN